MIGSILIDYLLTNMGLSSGTNHGIKTKIEKQLSFLFMQAPVGFCLAKGTDHTIELANKEFLRLTGRTAEIIGKTIIDIFPEIDGQGYLALLNRVLKDNETVTLNESPAEILNNGIRERLYVNTVFQPYLDGDDAVGVLAILTDVTDHVLVRKRIEESNLQLQFAATLTQNIADAVIGTSTSEEGYVITSWNKGAEIMYGWKSEEVIGKAAPEVLITQYFSEKDKNASQISLVQKGYWQGEVRQQRKDGTTIWVNASLAYVKNNNGKIIGAVGVNRDITKQKQDEEKFYIAQRQLELTIENFPAAVYLYDKTGTIIYVNKHGRASITCILGEDLKPGDEMATLMKKVLEKVEYQQENGQPLLPEQYPMSVVLHTRKESEMLIKRIYKTTGEINWFLNKVTPLLDEKGDVQFILYTNTDFTKQKSAEEKIRESEEKLRIITDAVPHMVWEIELDGIVSYINKQWANYSGLTLEEINQGGWSKVFHPEDAETVGRGWMDAFKNENVYVGECRIKNPQGSYSWFTLKTVPVKNDKGNVMLWIGTATDIHDKKIAEQQKDEFLSIASHELKTPVTSIKGFTQILKMRFEKEGNEQAVDLLSRMDKQVDKLTKLIVDLLDATKIENGQLKFLKEMFDFNDLITEIVEEMQRTTESHKITVKLLSDTKIINGDRNRIGQVITNLVSNAIKYSPKTDEIIVSTTNEKNRIKLCVKDLGIGIANEKQSKIFDRFFRVSGDKQETYPGLGLGLFISAEIIKRHKGKFSLQSAEGKGSTFCFTLPVIK